jgi:hypothetical protein
MKALARRPYERLEPLLPLLQQTVKAGIFMAMDETRVQVMGEEGRDKKERRALMYLSAIADRI